MAGSLRHTCPHCNAYVALLVVSQYQGLGVYAGEWWLFLQCISCGGAASARVHGNFAHEGPKGYGGDIRGAYPFALEAFAPQNTPVEAPENLPAPVESLFLQAANARRQRWTSAAAMTYRKTLEVALHQVAPGLDAKNLVGRINALADGHLITPAIKDWAHEIRLDGNVAAHEIEELSEEELGQLHAFTELTLMYLFTLPALVEAKRASRAAG